MNLWLRLLWYLLTRWRRGPLVPPLGVSRLDMRVLPNDLDVNLHMNNGRYLAVMDIGRFDLIARTGLLKVARRHKWIPVLSAAKVRFRRELRVFRKFRLETRIVWWARTHFVMEHRILVATPDGGETLATHALMLGGLYERAARRFVPISELMKALGVDNVVSPEAGEEVEAFLAAEQALRRAG